jgi:DNA-directed RNA polymerase subunit M/transcription elongation factor TFIIS
MAIVEDKIQCSKCGSNIDVKYDVPDPTEHIVIRESQEAVKEAERLKEELGKATGRVAEVEGELRAWQTGERHGDFDPEEVENCPNCGPKLQKYVLDKVRERVGKLTRDEVRTLARQWGDWPPPSIDFTALVSRKMK